MVYSISSKHIQRVRLVVSVVDIKHEMSLLRGLNQSSERLSGVQQPLDNDQCSTKDINRRARIHPKSLNFSLL